MGWIKGLRPEGSGGRPWGYSLDDAMLSALETSTRWRRDLAAANGGDELVSGTGDKFTPSKARWLTPMSVSFPPTL